MLTWITIKTGLKKTWAWLKHNWHAPVVVIYTVVLWVLFRRKDKAREILEIRAKSYEEQIKELNRLHEEEVQKRNDILDEYLAIVEELEKQHDRDNEKLDQKKKKEIKRLVEEYHEKPDELARMLADRYGFVYIKE